LLTRATEKATETQKVDDATRESKDVSGVDVGSIEEIVPEVIPVDEAAAVVTKEGTKEDEKHVQTKQVDRPNEVPRQVHCVYLAETFMFNGA